MTWILSSRRNIYRSWTYVIDNSNDICHPLVISVDRHKIRETNSLIVLKREHKHPTSLQIWSVNNSFEYTYTYSLYTGRDSGFEDLYNMYIFYFTWRWTLSRWLIIRWKKSTSRIKANFLYDARFFTFSGDGHFLI